MHLKCELVSGPIWTEGLESGDELGEALNVLFAHVAGLLDLRHDGVELGDRGVEQCPVGPVGNVRPGHRAPASSAAWVIGGVVR